MKRPVITLLTDFGSADHYVGAMKGIMLGICPDAQLVDGWFQWQPKRPPMPEVLLGNSGAAGEWRLCSEGQCQTLSEIFGHPVGANVTKISACDP